MFESAASGICATRLTPDVTRLTPDVARLTPDEAGLAADVARLTPDVARPTPDVARLTPDVARLTPDEALSELLNVQARAAALAAAEVRLLVRAGGATRVVREVLVEDLDDDGNPIADRDPRCVGLVDEVVEEIAAALHRSSHQVHSQLETARLLAGPLAATLEALSAGTISYGHARVIAEQAQRLQSVPLGEDAAADEALAEACGRLQVRVLPLAADLTVAQTRARAARIVTTIDRAAAAARRQRARQHCNVSLIPLDDGLAMIEAVMPALAAAAVMCAVDNSTRAHVADGTVDQFDLPADAGIGQVRAAVLADLVVGANSAGTRVEIGVVIDAATLAGINSDFAGLTPSQSTHGTHGADGTHGNAWVQAGAGAGGMVEIGRSDLLELLGSPDVHATMRRLVTDPASGALVDRGARSYRVSDGLKAWIQARDRTCSFPGCNRAARRCDVDHATDYRDGGATTIANTRALCRRHHNAKTHSGWQIVDSDVDGSCTFVSPAGRRYRHRAVPILE